MATNDDDLYGDLDGAVAKPAPPNASKSTSSTWPQMLSQSEVDRLRQQLKSLAEENDVLKKNMGILYRTAKNELERKDRAIDQLQSELDALKR